MRCPELLFQSTHSLRSATQAITLAEYKLIVSIHALLAECDRSNSHHRRLYSRFNPRTPCGVRPHGPPPAFGWARVSIHALLAECDNKTLTPVQLLPGFNPRTPCGVRLKGGPQKAARNRFQSTHSLRSATGLQDTTARIPSVSIHALLAECDCAQPYTLLLNKANHTLRQPP